MSNVVLVRHGETEWSASGRHTSRTDVDLTPRGEDQARALQQRLAGWTFGAIWSSPRLRARRTAELAHLMVTEYCDDLVEWDYGVYEGLTSVEIHQARPDWSLWTDGCPAGESPAQVGVRIDRLLADLAGVADRAGDIALIAHGHILRVVAARWLRLPVDHGSLFGLDPAGICELGFEHGRPILRHSNLPG